MPDSLYTAAEIKRQRDLMVKQQGGIDPILNEPFKEVAVLDHDHTTQHCRAALNRNTNAFEGLGGLWEPPEILGEVIRQYKEWYGDGVTYTAWNATEVTATWQDMLSLYFKFSYMKRSWNDPSDFRLFFADQGVIVE